MVSRPGRPPSRLGAGCCRHGIGGLAGAFGNHTRTLRRALPCPRPRVHGHVHGANLGVRADAYWRVGGFRPLHVGEDVDLVSRLVTPGHPWRGTPTTPCSPPTGVTVAPAADSATMCGRLPTTPSVPLPQRVAHDSDANVRVVDCRPLTRGMRTRTYPA